jgi:Zn-dependent alcohol dehydrogenase
MMDGTYRMHYEGQDLHQFLMISTFAQYAVVPEASLVKVPDDVPLEAFSVAASARDWVRRSTPPTSGRGTTS